MNVVITGANRGIGLELTRQYLDRGATVYAGVRTEAKTGELAKLADMFHGRLVIEVCDVSSKTNVRAFAESVNSPVDRLINNAGMRIQSDDLRSINTEEAEKVFRTNALGAFDVLQSFLPRLKQTPVAKIANISSGLGSIANNDSGGSIGYRMSKAALNMASRSMAAELRADGIIVLALSPGWVKTDMGGAQAPTTVEDSAAGLIRVIEAATLADSGHFLDFRGNTLPW